jgi:ferredoxin
MRLLFLYFSGTGNTDYVAHYLARKLGSLPVKIELRSVERHAAETLSDFDVLAFGFPVYACDSPTLVQDYLARLSPGEGRGAFVFCTKGAWAGSAVRRNLGRLAQRGYVPLGGESVAMPGSDGLAFIGKTSRLARSALQKDYDCLKAADRLAGQMAEILPRLAGGHPALAAGEPAEALRQPLPTSISGALVDPLWATLYDAVSNRFLTKFWADDRCSSCGLCERICPVDNIELRGGRPHFADRCMLCMRCIHACPEEAIQIGRATMDKFRWHGPKGAFKPLRLRPPR